MKIIAQQSYKLNKQLTALTMQHPTKKDKLLVQFDNFNIGRDDEGNLYSIAPIYFKSDIKLYLTEEWFCQKSLGFGWHEFNKSDFTNKKQKGYNYDQK